MSEPPRIPDASCFAEGLPFRSGSFDVVLATEVLEHVTDAEAAAEEIRRVLRPGGSLLATVPFIYPVHEAPYDFRRFTHHGLRSLVERHGFVDATVSPKGGVGLLATHFAIGGLVQVLDRLGDPDRPLALRAVPRGSSERRSAPPSPRSRHESPM